MSDRITVTQGGAKLSVLVSGQTDGPTILLSNSLGAGLDMWGPQRKMLERHYRVIGYDTRGHGRSNTPAGDYSFTDLTADAVAILDHFGAENTDFVGLSLGGMTGLGLGLDHADRFKKVVCACARSDAPQPFADSWDDRIAAIDKGGLEAIWTGTLERWLTPDFMANNTDTVDMLAADFSATTANGYTGCARALQTLDYKKRLGAMTTPVLYISGAEDLGAAASEMQSMHDATPGAQYVNIPNAAHIANLNQVDAFNAALKNFLEI
jgi:3-oxoadipate enol-lactonase